MRRFSAIRYAAGLCAAALIFSAVSAPKAKGQASAGKALTVERIFGQPSLSGHFTPGLEWSPDSKTLSYFHVEFKSGKPMRELWAMNPATGQTRVLVSQEQLENLLEPPKGKPSQATGLGRRTPASYKWAPDSKSLLFISEDQLVWMDLTTMKSRVLFHSDNEIQDAKISPDGKLVSYVEDHNLWDLPVDGGKPRELTTGGAYDLLKGQLDWVYPEELDLGTAYWWAPDSKHIAYFQMDESKVNKYPLVDLTSVTGETQMEHYPNAGGGNPIVHVGVVPSDGGATRWMDTGIDNSVYLARVAWLPDSKEVAIERLNRPQTQLDLLFCGAADGKSHVVLTEKDPYWINVNDDLHFLKSSNEFIWGSERSGFLHLYLYDTSGKLISQLTHGDWVVTGLEGVDEKNGSVYFTSTEKSPIETQLYRVPLTGGAWQQLTKVDGTHFIGMSPDGSAFVDFYTNAMLPPRADLYSADGTHIATINANNVPELAEYHLSPVKFLTVKTEDGAELYGSMILPANFDPAKRYPVLVNVYGGPGVHIVRDSWGGSIFLWHEMMAQKGYIIFTLDNRGANNRGHAFETPIYHHFGRIQLQDQLAGVRYLKSLPYVDGSRIGIWGWSFGGYMTITALQNAPDVFKCGFAGGPVTDWRQYDTIYTERYMGTPEGNPEGYKDSSPVNHVDGLKGKLLIAHGTGDDNVHFANTAEYVNRLIDADKYVEVAIYPGRGHGVSDPPAQLQLFQRVTKFFLDNL